MNSLQLRDLLLRVASNLSWTWDAELEQALRSLPQSQPGLHPVAVVASLTDVELESLADNAELVDLVSTKAELIEAYSASSRPSIAYCSPEFGLTALIPQYSGGLGVLAGDHLKAASDRGIPIVGLGLLYSNGVFRQSIEDGHQTEFHESVDPVAIGAADTGVEVEIPMPNRDVKARVWRLKVGAVELLLLSTDIADNRPEDRAITDHLYLGTSQHRLEQEMVLGVGGGRALKALGHEIEVHHLNEGHAGFLGLELLDRHIHEGDLAAAMEIVTRGLVFTTHTPVPAGIDRFHRDVIGPYLDIWANRWGVDFDTIWEVGQDPHDPARFNMAAFCLRLAGAANGVSRLHGEVSREMFTGVGIGADIGHVTNGVHARTWTSPHVQSMFDEALGEGWASGEREAWDRVEVISDDLVSASRRVGALRLADLVTASTGHKLDPDALILGFARRFAPYKRATLLFSQMERMNALLTDDERPVHFVFSGKAHPADQPGKDLVAQVASFAQSDEARGRFTFLPDYDMDVARVLVQGCDVWLNNPIRPREASGTSGEKVVLNGGLNCSILDGWWAELFDGQNGWAIPSSIAGDPGVRDAEESESLLAVIGEVAEEYHNGRAVFIGRIRHSWRSLGPSVTAGRMVADYNEQVYRPALERVRSG